MSCHLGDIMFTVFFLSLFVNQDAMFTLSVPLGVVSRVDKVGGIRSSGENSYGIEILCKVCCSRLTVFCS